MNLLKAIVCCVFISFVAVPPVPATDCRYVYDCDGDGDVDLRDKALKRKANDEYDSYIYREEKHRRQVEEELEEANEHLRRIERKPHYRYGREENENEDEE